MTTLTKADLHVLKDALDAVDEELYQLEYDNEWYCADTLDLLSSAKEIVYSALGLNKQEDEEDED